MTTTLSQKQINQIKELARDAASCFVGEYERPCENTDWDSEAWSIDMDSVDGLGGSAYEAAWEIYQSTLYQTSLELCGKR